MLREQVAMVRNSAGAGLRQQPDMPDMPDILGDLVIPARRISLGPKRGQVWGKEDVWSP